MSQTKKVKRERGDSATQARCVDRVRRPRRYFSKFASESALFWLLIVRTLQDKVIRLQRKICAETSIIITESEKITNAPDLTRALRSNTLRTTIITLKLSARG